MQGRYCCHVNEKPEHLGYSLCEDKGVELCVCVCVCVCVYVVSGWVSVFASGMDLIT